MTVVPPVLALPAATLLLLRDGAAGLEVLMLERHRDAFFSGALVFPGGRVDDCDGAAGSDAAFRVAAIRESYEEARILLARDGGDDHLIAASALAVLDRRLRARIGRPPHFADLLGDGGIALATDRLVPFARWVTPARSPKRYDTMFFLALAPQDQVPEADGREAVEIVWLSPKAAIAEADAKRRRLIFATRMNLMRLARHASAQAALADAAASAAHIAPICPEIYDTPTGTRIRIPEGLGYEVFDLPTPDPRHG